MTSTRTRLAALSMVAATLACDALEGPDDGAGGPIDLQQIDGLFIKRTAFASEAEYRQELDRIRSELDGKTFTGSLPRPDNAICDEVALAIAERLGEVSVAGTVLFDARQLRAACAPTGEQIVQIAAGAPPDRTVWATQRPWRMVGHSWFNNNYGVYRSTGGETMFEKRREKFFKTAWWGLDADRVGVRIYLFNCPSVPVGHPFASTCFSDGGRSYSDWDSGDDYVSVRDWAMGIKASFNFNGFLPTGLKTVPQLPYIRIVPSNANQDWYGYYTSGGRPITNVPADALRPELFGWQINFEGIGTNFIDFVNNSEIPWIPVIQGNANAVGIAEGVLTMHSVKHGSMEFRAISSAGLRSNLVHSWTSFDYVSW